MSYHLTIIGEGIVRTKRNYFISIVCLLFGFMATSVLGQETKEDPWAEELGAGAKLVVRSVSGPAKALLNRKVSISYTVKNKGKAASGAYKVRLYLSSDNETIPADARLLATVNFATGLAPGEIRKTTSKVRIPINALSGSYYFAAKAGGGSRVSAKEVAIVRFAVSTDGKVVDHKTALTWQQADDGITRNWQEATEYCRALVLGDKADWRLPSIAELETIIDYSRYDPAIDPVFECGLESYWSSSTVLSNLSGAWHVVFAHGNVLAATKNNNYYARCVRGTPW